MELRHLRYFIAVAEELHFGKAAERLNISQPPLSQQIKQLEKQINTTLFYRTNRNVELTEAGKAFYKHAVKILNQINIAQEDARSVAEGENGILKVGFSGTITLNVLPEIIKTSQKYHPGIALQLLSLTTSQQIAALEQRQIDIGFLVPPVESSLISTKKLQDEEYIICLPENHRLAHKDKINVADLKNDSFISTSRDAGVGYFDTIDNIFKDAGFTPRISQIANDQLTMVSFVASGLGVVIIPKAAESLTIDGVIYKELHKPYTKVNSIAWNKENTRPVVQKFLNLVSDRVIPSL